MCEPKPGPRCSPHTKETWESAKTALQQAQAKGIPDKVTEAKHKEEKAKWDYLTSPDGIDLLRRAAEGAKAKGNEAKAAEFTEMMNDAVEAREHQTESLKRLRAEQARQEQERTSRSNVVNMRPHPGAVAAAAARSPLPRPGMPRPGLPRPASGQGSLIRKLSKESSQKPLAKMARDGRTPVSTSGYAIKVQPHAFDMAAKKGFSEERICETFANPTKIYPSGSRYPNQHRIINGDLCLVGEFEGKTFRVITVYEDGVVTAPRADQLNTDEGREFAARYAAYGDTARAGTRARQLA